MTVLFLEAGDCVPADGKLAECASLKVDESALTGESLSVENLWMRFRKERLLVIRRIGYFQEVLLRTDGELLK